MINPLRGTLLNGQWFNYVPGSYREVMPLKNSAELTQNSKTFSIQGTGPESFTITLALENSYTINFGSSQVGSTTWLGVSRLNNLKTITGGLGVSMPIVFVNPYGASFNVVPTGSLDIQALLEENPAVVGTEFRVSLTLESTGT